LDVVSIGYTLAIVAERSTEVIVSGFRTCGLEKR